MQATDRRLVSLWSKLIRYGILTLLVGLFVFYLATHREEILALRLVRPDYLFILVALFLLQYGLIALITRILVGAFGFSLTPLQAFGTAVLTGFYNLITPVRGGIAARGHYLKSRHNFPYTRFAATFSARYILFYLAAGLLGIISLRILAVTGLGTWPLLFWSLVSVVVVLVLLVLLSPRIPENQSSLLGLAAHVLEGWHALRSRRRLVVAILLLSTVEVILGAIDLQLRFLVFDVRLGFVPCLLLSSLNSVALLLGITPAGLGINEAVQVLSAQLLAVPVPVALAVSLSQRAITSVMLLSLGPLFSYWLYRGDSISERSRTGEEKTG